MKEGIFEKTLTEEGIFYLVATISIVFSAFLVVNYQAGEKVFFGYTVILLIACVYRFMQKADYFDSYDLFSKNILWDIGIGVGLAALWYFTLLNSPYGVIPLPPLPAEVLAIGPASFLIVVFLAPIAEEYFFRGSLLPQFVKIFGTKWDWLPALLISAGAFAMFHWGVYQGFAMSSATIAAFLLGLFTGGICLWRKQFLSAIIMHAIINFAIVSPAFVVVA
jgi:membrane protease YdiL (CAAX protease family)